MTDRTIRVVLDSSGVTAGARGARGALGGVQRQTGLVTNGFRAAARAAQGLFAVLGAREVLRTANTFQELQNSLRVVTDSTEELTAANTRLFEIAQATRTPVEATVQLFSRASIAADELGASQEELFKLTEITGQALAVQGGSAQEASGALRQLSQSFSSGIVRAEEFNSILEGAFPLAQAAARGFEEAGGSVGKLRNLVVEGKVSSQEFFQAILDGGEVLEQQFGQAIPTVSQALTNLNTAFIGFIGQLDSASSFSANLAETILEMAEGLSLLGDAFTNNLDPSDELSENFQNFAIAGILAISVLEGLFDLLGVLKGAFVDFGEGLGAVAAATAALFEGDFAQAGRILDEIDFSNTQAEATDFLESLDANVQAASESISQVLLPSFRSVREEAEAVAAIDTDRPLINPNAAEDLKDAADDVADFQAALNQQTEELRLTATEGDNAAEAILQYRGELELAAAAQEIFGDLVPTEEVDALRAAFVQFGEEALASQIALREEIEAQELAETFDDQIEALEEEIALLGASNEVIALNAEARALAAGATEEQAARIGELTEALLNEKDIAAEALPTLQDFFDDVSDSAQGTLAGILADPLQEGLDEVPFKFAQLLQELAAEALAAEVFKILGNLGGGGGGGGFLGFLGGLFGGGFQAGGTVRGGQPIVVGERGPELFTPPGSGAIEPNVNINQAAQAPPTVNVVNVSDPADIPSGIETPEGNQAVINVIQKNPEAIRRVLG